MRFVSSALLLVVCVAAAADPVRELTALEQKLTDALVRSDAATVDALWADDLVWIGLNGKPSSKAEQLASMKGQAATAPSSVSATNKDVEVRLYGSTAVVTVRSTWTTRTDAGERASDYIATHVWSERGGRWRLVSAHISRVAQ